MPITFQPTSDFDVAVAQGAMANSNGRVYRHAAVHGRSTVAVGTGTPIANNAFWFPTEARRVRIKAGGNANDDAAGTAAREITIVGLDVNLDLAVETLATNGAGASLLSTTFWWRINQVYVSKVGTYGGINIAAITLEDTSPGDVLTITARESVSNMAIYSVPRKHTGLMRYAAAAIGGSVAVTVFLVVRPDLDAVDASLSDVRAALRARTLQAVNAGFYNFDLERAPIVIPEKSDVYAVGSSASATPPVSLFANVLLIPNS